MFNRKSFMDRALNGEFLDPAEALDDEIDAWHESRPVTCELHEWLGMSFAEYKLWAEKPRSLSAILAARKYDLPMEEFFALYDEPDSMALAARGGTPGEMKAIREWLRKQTVT